MAAEREDPAQKVSTPGEAEAAATQSRPASDAAPPLPASPGVQTAEDSTTGAATAASAVDSAAGDPATCVCTPGEEALRSEREATRGRSGRGRSTESCGFTRLSGSIFSSSSLGSSGLGGGDNGASACADSQRPFKDRARRQKTPCGLPRPLFLSLLAVYTLLTGKVFSGWPSLSNLLLREGAFEWLCDDEAAAPAPGVSEARCEAQLLAVNKLFAICLATSFSFSFVAGFLLDRVGPKATALAGNFISLFGWTLLGFCNEGVRAFEAAFAFIAMGGDLAFMPVLSVANLFPEKEGLIIALLGGARSLSYGIPLFLEALNDPLGLPLKTVACGFAATGPGLCLLFAVLCVPRRRFSSWTDLLVEAAEAEASSLKAPGEALLFSDDPTDSQPPTPLAAKTAAAATAQTAAQTEGESAKADEKAAPAATAASSRPRPLRLLTYDFGLLGYSECVRGTSSAASEALGSQTPVPISPKSSENARRSPRGEFPSLKSISRRLSAVHFTADDAGEARAREEEPHASLPQHFFRAGRHSQRGVVIAYNSNKLQRHLPPSAASELPLPPSGSTPCSLLQREAGESLRESLSRGLKFNLGGEGGPGQSSAALSLATSAKSRMDFNRRCATLPPSTASAVPTFAETEAVNAARRVVRLYRLQSFYVPGLQEDALVERMVQKGSVLARASVGSVAIAAADDKGLVRSSAKTAEEKALKRAAEEEVFVPSPPPKIQRELLSGYFAGLVAFFSMHALLYAYFATNSELILGPQFNRLLGVALPFTFAPSIVLGKLVDCVGILWVMFILQFSVSAVYALSASTSAAARAVSVLFYSVFVSFHASSTYCFVGDTFRAAHMGTLTGLVFMVGGLLSLLKIPLQGALSKAFDASRSSRGPLCLLALCAGGFAVWGCLFFLKRKDAHPFWPDKAKEAAALLEERRRHLHRRRVAALKRRVRRVAERVTPACKFVSRKRPRQGREYAIGDEEAHLDAFV